MYPLIEYFAVLPTYSVEPLLPCAHDAPALGECGGAQRAPRDVDAAGGTRRRCAVEAGPGGPEKCVWSDM